MRKNVFLFKQFPIALFTTIVKTKLAMFVPITFSMFLLTPNSLSKQRSQTALSILRTLAPVRLVPTIILTIPSRRNVIQ